MKDSLLYYLMVAGAVVSGIGFGTALENLCNGEIGGMVYVTVGIIGMVLVIPLVRRRQDLKGDIAAYWLSYAVVFMLIIMVMRYLIDGDYGNIAWIASIVVLAVLAVGIFIRCRKAGTYDRVDELA